jgi:hypothetical protein
MFVETPSSQPPCLIASFHHATVIQIEGASYRLREHAYLVPENIRSNGLIQPTPIPPTLKRRGRPPKSGGLDENDG